jgi:hypothetical protein
MQSAADAPVAKLTSGTQGGPTFTVLVRCFSPCTTLFVANAQLDCPPYLAVVGQSCQPAVCNPCANPNPTGETN